MPATGCNPGPRPAFISAPNCAKAVMRYRLFNQTVENVYHFLGTAAWSIAQLESLANALDATWVTYFANILPPQLTLVDITCTALDVNTGPQWIKAVDAVGTDGNPAFADPAATFAIKFATDKIGRSYRGRMYWPALIGLNVSNGTIQGSYADAMTGAIRDAMALVQTDVGCQHVVLSYQHNCAWRATGVATPIVAYTYADLNIDSQRRRLVGRGI